ncbi:MAG TPA: hypothetical protein VKH43_06355 [Thermoanaerobaculia bacterium]|nr:hypothetical protein [Thermoanaerobaculia bacterium]
MEVLRFALLPALLVAAVAKEPRAVSVPAVLTEFDRVCRLPFWPGFEPCRIPLVLFDGEKTWLVRHPAPPAEFAASGDRDDARVFEGRHASVRANTSVDLAGTPTASAIVQGPVRDPVRLAALLVHETFHVFQGRRHPGWGANEADLFVYPVEDSRALALRRLESLALRRALAAGRARGRAAWAARALETRRERFALLPAAAGAYERGTELKEGLARYVQWLAGDVEPLFPDGEFAAAAVRDRAYSSGAAMALLLDSLDPGWKGRLEEGGSRWLEDLLATAAGPEKPEAFARADIDRETRRAASEAAALGAERERKRRGILEGPGWKLIFEPAEPLQSQGFDPLNVERLAATEVLHTRFVKLANSAGSVEVLGLRCLTESAGKHPLFEGIRRATIELPGPPRIEEDAGTIRITSEGLTVAYRGGLTARGQVYIIH